MSTAHVTPLGDTFCHQTDTDEADCPCGPQTRPIELPEGRIGWLHIHHSLDGREQHEPT
jgi:phenylacetate-coenzyme A ligase PaaK-like adenylate-forming protein